MLEATWRLELEAPRCTALLPEWSRELVSRYYWRFDPMNDRIYSELGVRLRDLVVNAPAGSDVTVKYEAAIAHAGQLGVWDWRTVELVRRSGPGFCLSRYRYVYQDPSGMWGLWLPVEGMLRYFGAFGGEDEAAIAANYLGPKWCPAQFRVERVERRAGDITPKRSIIAAVPGTQTTQCPAQTREVRSWIEWADGTIEMIEP